MADETERARLAAAITVIEGRLIAARHLRLADRVRLLESEKARLERRLAALPREPPHSAPTRSTA
ncbi:MAG TPA: hypothetical protein VE993_08970 [Stellaceae bacterium]|nr:hypothetical protein [Stellaceae bacterium]